MQATFCGVCRHRTDVPPGHEENCPVLTQEPVRPWMRLPSEAIQQMLQAEQSQGAMAGNVSTVCPYCGGLNGMHQWASGSPCPGTNTPLGRTYQQNPFMIRQGQIPTDDGYEVAKIYKEARERLLQELKAQVEVNRKLARELIDVRLELAALKLKHA